MDLKSQEMSVQCYLLNVELIQEFCTNFDMFKALIFSSEEEFRDIMVNLWHAMANAGDFLPEKRTVEPKDFTKFPFELETGNTVVVFVFPDSMDSKRLRVETKAWAIVLPKKDATIKDLKQSDLQFFTLEYYEEKDEDDASFAVCGWQCAPKKKDRIHLNYNSIIRPDNKEEVTIARFLAAVQAILENDEKPAVTTQL